MQLKDIINLVIAILSTCVAASEKRNFAMVGSLGFGRREAY